MATPIRASLRKLLGVLRAFYEALSLLLLEPVNILIDVSHDSPRCFARIKKAATANASGTHDWMRWLHGQITVKG